MRRLMWPVLCTAALVQACGGDPCAAGKSVFTGQLHPDCVSSSSSGGTSSGPVLASGSGNGGLVVPAGVSAVQIIGSTSATADNFVVRIAGRLTVNEVLDGGAPAFSGVYPVTTGASIAVSAAPQTRWTISGTSLGGNGSGLFSAAGSGDQAFTLPTRSSSYRVQAQYTGPSQNFILLVDGRAIVNVILGSLENRTQYSNSFALNGGTASIVSSTGVTWSITESPP